ncbi:MAG: hypothetical protein ISR82_08140 [Candidatus Marinimicrobia bacterium]|nr:hypothetical protein [Candidatus Neomarinimicrobiota bacterium]
MNDRKTKIQNTIIQVIVRNNCQICDRILDELESIPVQINPLEIQVFNIDIDSTIPDHCQPFITPAIWVNGNLWYLGGFDRDRFYEKLMLLDKRSLTSNPANIGVN